MCVIAFSPKGVKAPAIDEIKAMFSTNPDGAGYAYNDKNGKVVYHKGFMTVEELLEELSPLEQWENTNLAIHFRIGTAGKNDAHTCHPFKISTSFGELRKLHDTDAKSVLFHNGILDDGGMLDPLSSDTQDFVSAFAPMLEKYGKSKNRDHAIAEYTKGNRLLVMYEDNKFKLWGEWKELPSGLMVSNTNWQYKTYSYGYYPYHYSMFDEDYYTNYGLNEKVLDKDLKEELARDSWNILMKEGYDWYTSSDELEEVIKMADESKGNSIFKDGVEFYVDRKQKQIWNADF